MEVHECLVRPDQLSEASDPRTMVGLITVFVLLVSPVQAQTVQNPPATTDQPVSRAAAIQPTFADVVYGPYDRNRMDVWLAESNQPTPVLISIHGGAFRHGDKSISASLLKDCLASGISVVAITYRFSQTAIAPAQHLDAALRHSVHSAPCKGMESRPNASCGQRRIGSAGISLWLGFHDDLADTDHDDPVLRQSTRLSCLVVNNAQSSYDPRFIRDLFPGTDTYQNSALAELFDVDLSNIDKLSEEKYELFEQVSAINHLTGDDVPVLMTYDNDFETPVSSRSIGIHHPRFGKVLQEQMNELGIECRVETGMSRGDRSRTKLAMAFLKQYLSAPPTINEGIPYGAAEGVELKLDLARPSGAGPFPAIVFIHGGGWYLGNRQSYRAEIESAARRGYVGVAISYRLMQFDAAQKETTTAKTIFPAQIHDAKAAIRYLRANADKFQIDRERIGVTGRSAGGQLSLLLGLTDLSADLEGSGGNSDQSSRVQAVVNVFGPTDMAKCYQTSSVGWIFRLVTGGTPDQVAAIYRAASPVTYASADDPPVLTLHGEIDQAVPVAQAPALDEKLRSVGAAHTLAFFPGRATGLPASFASRSWQRCGSSSTTISSNSNVPLQRCHPRRRACVQPGHSMVIETARRRWRRGGEDIRLVNFTAHPRDAR